ncbi:TonB-dependent receptor plug domain-containing protein [Massilia sp. Dwa41.01b]|uniref:TonB-dependent receptor plug domain-containing protein n=1 Tax=Massilia sp. Dwa41.01b TaxID=2709302 RepID=UPI0015FFCAE4|nr:TonB-dependent receptor plug domain-containing protein [Massilia sp. Dwa41.01b]QNA90742.1 TonB-dependent receptor plug domain-containing protein [Massilia sp. Dwa41.01b]
MPRFLTLSLLFPCSLALAQQGAEPPPTAPYRVEVQGASTQDQRREATVARLVVGRADIARYGDNSLAQVLKRQPGIAIVGSEVRMRGLGAGYTQILIDGQPAPQGFSIDSIAPELVERIEVSRSASADQSTQAVAGSINIVLRKRAGPGREDKATLGYRRSEWNPGVSTRFGGRDGSLSWSVGATLEQNTEVDLYATDEAIDGPDGRPLVLRRIDERAAGRIQRLNVAPTLNWDLADGDTLAWQTLLEATRIRSGMASREAALLGDPSAYPDSVAAIGPHRQPAQQPRPGHAASARPASSP